MNRIGVAPHGPPKPDAEQQRHPRWNRHRVVRFRSPVSRAVRGAARRGRTRAAPRRGRGTTPGPEHACPKHLRTREGPNAHSGLQMPPHRGAGQVEVRHRSPRCTRLPEGPGPGSMTTCGRVGCVSRGRGRGTDPLAPAAGTPRPGGPDGPARAMGGGVSTAPGSPRHRDGLPHRRPTRRAWSPRTRPCRRTGRCPAAVAEARPASGRSRHRRPAAARARRRRPASRRRVRAREDTRAPGEAAAGFHHVARAGVARRTRAGERRRARTADGSGERPPPARHAPG